MAWSVGGSRFSKLFLVTGTLFPLSYTAELFRKPILSPCKKLIKSNRYSYQREFSSNFPICIENPKFGTV